LARDRSLGVGSDFVNGISHSDDALVDFLDLGSHSSDLLPQGGLLGSIFSLGDSGPLRGDTLMDGNLGSHSLGNRFLQDFNSLLLD
jgi:hypothetical protein